MQVPAYVEYEKATSVEHALGLLARFGPEARILAGGHSLIPMMKLRLAQPETLVDINGLTELSYIEVTGRRRRTELRIGALTRHAQLLADPAVGAQFAILHDAEQVIADPIVRNWGTIGGSLCQADPSEDLSAAFAALKATMVIRHPGGSRTVPARDFHTGPYETVVAPGELLTEIRIAIRPAAAARTRRWAAGSATGRSARPGRPCGWTVTRRPTGSPRRGSGSPRSGAEHFAAAEAEEFLRGAPATEDSFARAGQIAAEHCHPVSDQRGPADYKRHLARELTDPLAAPRHGSGPRTAPDVQITVTVNGISYTREVEARLLLIHFLRDELRLTGSHWGCDTSNCGACVVWLDETPVKSCTVLAAMADGRQVRTVEGLAHGAGLDPVQQGFTECHGLQCGFCTPGMMLTARWLLDHNPDPSAAEIREALSGQLCRCTGYENIVRSVQWAAKHEAATRGAPRAGDGP